MGLTAAAAVLLVITLVGGIAWQRESSALPRRPSTDRTATNPIEIEGIAGDGGLRVEKDLAIGRASVAIVERHGCLRGHRGRRRPPPDRPPRLRRTPVRQDGRRDGVDCPRSCRCPRRHQAHLRLARALHATADDARGRCAESPGRAGSRAAPGCWISPRCHRHVPVRSGWPRSDDPDGQAHLELPVVARQPAGGVLRGTDDQSGLGGERGMGRTRARHHAEADLGAGRAPDKPSRGSRVARLRRHRSTCRERGRPGRLGGYTSDPWAPRRPRAHPDERDGRRPAIAAASRRRQMGRWRGSPRTGRRSWSSPRA